MAIVQIKVGNKTKFKNTLTGEIANTRGQLTKQRGSEYGQKDVGSPSGDKFTANRARSQKRLTKTKKSVKQSNRNTFKSLMENKGYTVDAIGNAYNPNGRLVHTYDKWRKGADSTEIKHIDRTKFNRNNNLKVDPPDSNQGNNNNKKSSVEVGKGKEKVETPKNKYSKLTDKQFNKQPIEGGIKKWDSDTGRTTNYKTFGDLDANKPSLTPQENWANRLDYRGRRFGDIRGYNPDSGKLGGRKVGLPDTPFQVELGEVSPLVKNYQDTQTLGEFNRWSRATAANNKGSLGSRLHRLKLANQAQSLPEQMAAYQQAQEDAARKLQEQVNAQSTQLDTGAQPTGTNTTGAQTNAGVQTNPVTQTNAGVPAFNYQNLMQQPFATQAFNPVTRGLAIGGQSPFVGGGGIQGLQINPMPASTFTALPTFTAPVAPAMSMPSFGQAMTIPSVL